MLALLLALSGLSLVGSFICSLFEASLLSVTPSQIEVMKRNKRFGAEKLAVLRLRFDEAISAILTINTITHTVGSAWCGAIVGQYYGEQWLGVFAAVFTFAILALTEIVPKSLGVAHAANLAPLVAWPVQIMIWSVWPVVKFSRLLATLAVGPRRQEGAPTEDEIMAMTRLAAERGQVLPQEMRWVENALRLDRVKAYDLMTPRTVVYSLPADLPLSAIKERSEHWGHSRLPLTEDRDPDRILGMVHRRDVFDALVKGHANLKLRDLMRPIDFVPDTMRGHQLLDKFITEKKHMVAVVNEYGGFEGVLTLEDVLECMLGSEIVDEFDRHPDMQQLARHRALQRAPSAMEPAKPDTDAAALPT